MGGPYFIRGVTIFKIFYVLYKIMTGDHYSIAASLQLYTGHQFLSLSRARKIGVKIDC